MNSLYFQFNASEATADTGEAIERLRGLSPKITTAVISACMGLIPEIKIQEPQYDGDEASRTWDVKHKATVENEVKLVSQVLPLNCKAICHFAKQIFVARNQFSPVRMFEYIWINYPDAFREKLVRNEAERTEVYSNSEGEAIGRLGGVLRDLTIDAYGVEETGEQLFNQLQIGLSELAQDANFVAMIDMQASKDLLNDVVSEFNSFMRGRLSGSHFAIHYAVYELIPSILPPNVTLTDHEKVQVTEVLKSLSTWKI